MPRVPDAVQRSSRCSAEPGPILAVVMLWAPALRSTTPLPGAVHRIQGTSEREQHRLRKQRAEQSRTQPIVVRFAWREREMDRQNDIEAAAY